ncbi:MAG: hypothetical protein DMG32_16105 [Acidobacteria bacterium]|nr:MAG: hypothetical protein DMG32_16105 [Acidobacteriota bacterium]
MGLALPKSDGHDVIGVNRGGSETEQIQQIRMGCGPRSHPNAGAENATSNSNRSNFGPIQRVAVSAGFYLSDTRCSTYLIFTAFFASMGSGG